MVNATELYWKQKLWTAAQEGKLEVIEEALANGADINDRDMHGNTALHFASFNGKIEVVKALLEKEGVDINAKKGSGVTALHCASQEGHTEAVKALLQQDGIEINAEDEGGNTALDIANNEGRTEIAEIIEAKIAKIAEREKMTAEKELKQRQAAKRRTMVERFTGKDGGEGKGI